MNIRKHSVLLLALIVLALVPTPVLAAGECNITSAAVYSSYYTTGDWLVVLGYNNTLEPYYPANDPSSAFTIQLLSGTTVLAQGSMEQWGLYRPAGIYMSAASVTSLSWGGAYTVRIIGTADPDNDTDSYALVAGDWKGSSLDSLDSWCLSLAGAAALADGVEYTEYTTEKGLVLNEVGGAIFVLGITGLMEIRPGLFQYAVSSIPYTEGTWTGAYSGGFDPWYTQLGTDISTLVNSTADTIDTDGSTLLLILLFAAYLVCAIIMMVNGLNAGAFAVLSPFLIAGYMLDILPWTALGVAIAVLVMLLVRQLWWKST